METTINQFQTLSKLGGLDQAECRNAMSNYDIFMNKLQLKVPVRILIAHLVNAEKNHLNENNGREKKSLLQAMNIIDSYKVTDKELRKEKLRDYITGTFLTSEKIAMRLDELGEEAEQQ